MVSAVIAVIVTVRSKQIEMVIRLLPGSTLMIGVPWKGSVPSIGPRGFSVGLLSFSPGLELLDLEDIKTSTHILLPCYTHLYTLTLPSNWDKHLSNEYSCLPPTFLRQYVVHLSDLADNIQWSVGPAVSVL